MKEIIKTDKAPQAIGPYSQAVIMSGNKMLFISGQIPLNPETMKLEGETAAEQCKLVMENLGQILKTADADYTNVVKTTIFLADMNDFAAVNEVYGSYFAENPPARATVQVGRLPLDVKVEIDAIAVL